MGQRAYINGTVIRDDQAQSLTVITQDGKIQAVTSEALPADFEGQVIDLQGKYLLPGFIDIHTHGGFNVDANHATAEDLHYLAKQFASRGTTAFNLSIVTDEPENVLAVIDNFLTAKKQGTKGAHLLGIHLEGPFLSHDYRGSMPAHLLTGFDKALFDDYLSAAQGQVNYITLAPEVQGVGDHIGYVQDQGVTVSLGHSAATYQEAMDAIHAGAKACTHTFNAMRLFHQHEPGLMGAVLEADSVYCEAICDGRHLHPGTVRLLLKTKGWDRVVAITDSIMAAGLPDGKYKLGVNDIVVVNGDAKLAYEDVRAGSTLTMDQALRNIMAFTGAPIQQVSRLLSLNPAKLLGIDQEFGSIDPGKREDLVIMDKDLKLLATFVGGQQVYENRSDKE